MTREEIKQEAEEQVNTCTPYHTGSFIQGYIAAAETWQERYEKQKEINKEQLSIARDILERFIINYKNKTIYVKYIKPLLVQAEQFLEETR